MEKKEKGRVPSFAEFVKMINPDLEPEKVEEMAAMFERMTSFETACSIRGVGITAGEAKERQRVAQELYDRVKEMVTGKGHCSFLTVSTPSGNKELFRRLEGLPDTADVLFMIEPRMSGDQVVSYDFVKGRQDHPDAMKVEADTLPDWLKDIDLPLAPIDRDVQSQYLNPIGNPSVRTLTLSEPSFEESRGHRSLLGQFAVARNRGISGDITINGKQRKELVSNAKGTMVYPRTKPKFGRR